MLAPLTGAAVPAGLEMAAVGLLLCEAVSQFAAAGIGQLAGAGIGGGTVPAPAVGSLLFVVMSSLGRILFSLNGDMATCAEQFREYVVACFWPWACACMLALSAGYVVRGPVLCAGWTSERSESEHRTEMIVEQCVGVMMSGFYAAWGLVAIWMYYPEVVVSYYNEFWVSPIYCYACTVSTACTCVFALLAGLNCTCSSASRFTSRLMAYGWTFGWGLSLIQGPGLLGDWRFLSHFGFISHLCGLATANKAALNRAAKDGTYGNVRQHIVHSQVLWDQVCLGMATLVWKCIVLPAEHICSSMLPREMRVYACPIPIFDLGQGVNLGVAAHFAPKNAPGYRDRKPKHVVCNVGQIALDSSKGLFDIQRTMNSLREIWEEFSSPSVQGLVSNTVCVFPNVKEQKLCKEVNFSVWESGQDAYNWYAASPGHKRILSQHNSGFLKTFGNLLASLEPSGPIRFQTRCKHCTRVVESYDVGSLPPKECGVCNGPTFQYPNF